MTVRFGEDGGFKAIIGGLLGGLGLGTRSAKVGDIISIQAGECLVAPPQGRLWYSPAGMPNLYQLHDLIRRPVLEVGDIFGIHPSDPIPLPPNGARLEVLLNPEPPLGAIAAVLYKVVWPPELAAVVALPKPRPPDLETWAINELPPPVQLPGRRWQPVYVDGRNLNNVVGVLVAA